MFDLFLAFCGGAILGAIVGGLFAMAAASKPKDREVIENCLKHTLPSDQFVTFEWLFCHLELCPDDMPTLRHVLELYAEEGVIHCIESNGVPHYKLVINILA